MADKTPSKLISAFFLNVIVDCSFPDSCVRVSLSFSLILKHQNSDFPLKPYIFCSLSLECSSLVFGMESSLVLFRCLPKSHLPSEACPRNPADKSPSPSLSTCIDTVMPISTPHQMVCCLFRCVSSSH